MVRRSNRCDGRRYRRIDRCAGWAKAVRAALQQGNLRDAALSRLVAADRSLRRLAGLQPLVDELAEPGAAGGIVLQLVRKMRLARLGVGQGHALMAARGPAAHGVVRD